MFLRFAGCFFIPHICQEIKQKMPKSSKRFVISDSSINEYEFRTLTAGIVLDQYLKNPILLWMHSRPWRGTKDEVLPIGTMTDIAVEGDKVLGTPVFDDNDEFAMTIYNKVESGILKMCSPGLKVLTWSDDPEHILPGQKRATAIKSVLREVSICDIGANNNALVLYDENDELINLSDRNRPEFIPLLNPNKMTVELKDIAGELNLTDQNPAAVLTAIQNLKQELANSKETVELLQKAKTDEQIDAYLADCAQKGKITAAEIDKYKKLSGGNLTDLKDLLDAKPEYKTLHDKTHDGKQGKEDLSNLSWDELDKKGLLQELKDKDLETFKSKYKAEFGVEYKDKK